MKPLSELIASGGYGSIYAVKDKCYKVIDPDAGGYSLLDDFGSEFTDDAKPLYIEDEALVSIEAYRAKLSPKCTGVITRNLFGSPTQAISLDRIYGRTLHEGWTSKVANPSKISLEKVYVALCELQKKLYEFSWEHNDLHANNIMVSCGQTPRVYIIDWGLASAAKSGYAAVTAERLGQHISKVVSKINSYED